MLKGKHKRFVLYVATFMLLTAMIFGMLPMGTVKAADGTITEYHMVTYGVMRVGHFQINGQNAWCCDHDKTTPPRGTAVNKISGGVNDNMRKALWYGYGGPGSIVSSNDQGWTLTSMALSLARGTATTHNTEMINWYNSVIQKPAPPSSFVVQVWSTGNSSYQQLATWTYTPNGTLSLTKEIDGNTDLTNICPGNYSLDGTEFSVTNSAGSSVGTIKITNGKANTLSLPAGTYTVKETKASDGFVLNPNSQTVTITANQTSTVTFKNKPLFDPISVLLKKVNKDGDPIPGAVFTVKYFTEYFTDAAEADSKTPVRTWEFTTKDNGAVLLLDSYKTGGDELFKDDSGMPVGLPGTYVFEETSAPDGYLPADPVAIKLESGEITGETQIFNTPEIADDLELKTTAMYDTGAKSTTPETSVTVVDEVSVKNLTVDREYTVKGKLVDKEDESNVIAEGETVFTATAPEMTVKVEFTFDASALEGKEIVVFEDLYHDDKQLASHAELEDEDQKITVPEIKTSAADKADGDKLITNTGTQTIVDTISYKALIPGKEYKVKTTLMNLETGEPIKDAGGSEITGETTFTPEAKDGTVDVELSFDATILNGETLVIFEDVYEGSILVGQHAVLEDEDQTIYVPGIKTQAENASEEIDVREGKVIIEDTVEYKNLTVGKTYTLKGTLVDKESGEPLKNEDGEVLTAETTFTAEASEGSEVVTFETTFELTHGKTYVAFEEIWEEDLQIAIHADIEDEDQTVDVPEIGTKAEDATTKTDARQNVAKITDTVSYKGLTPGQTYMLQGTLVYKDNGETVKDSNGKEIKVTTFFTADAKEGTAEVKFTVPHDLVKEKQCVVFEDLYEEGRLIAVHADIEDQAQTVRVPDVPKTGDTVKLSYWMFLGGAVVLSAAAVATLLIIKKRVSKQNNK